GKSSWLRELENISVGHGVSLLCWRSGGVEHPHDTPPYPFTPSPTFAHSSRLRAVRRSAVTVSESLRERFSGAAATSRKCWRGLSREDRHPRWGRGHRHSRQ